MIHLKNKTLKELEVATISYLSLHRNSGGSSEFDPSINAISRAIIERMAKEEGEAWMFKINRYNDDQGKPFMVKYEGQKIFNSQYAGVVPKYDKELEDLLIDYANNSGYPKSIWKKLKVINDKIYEINGTNLFWT